MQKLFIISNESIYTNKGKFFCDNIDMKSTPEGLANKFHINVIARESQSARSHNINLKNIKTFKNIFSFLYGILSLARAEDSKYLIVSISPFTTMACVILSFFKKKPIVYLRSDGYGEYKSIFGFLGPLIYHFMFITVSKISHLISCREYILKGKKGHVVSPSQLTDKWFSNIKENQLEKIKLLYVGRIKKEKGIFSLLKILKNNPENITLSILGAEKAFNTTIKQNNVNVYDIENNVENLIKFYDNHNIFVLPSYTEGHPMALLEALSRFKPVIIFKEIEHVIEGKKGIFVAERNSRNFLEKVSYIMNNYEAIQRDMKENTLPTKSDFLKEISKLVSDLK